MKKSEAKDIFLQGEEATIKKLLELDRELEKLKKKHIWKDRNSQNSSKPPSLDSALEKKKRKQQNKKKKSNKNAGGQPGHKGARRELLPTSEVDHVVPIYPDSCEKCNASFSEKSHSKDDVPVSRWQVAEIPEIKPTTTEYQCFSKQCNCGHCTNGKLPDAISSSNFGPRLTAIIAYMTSVMRGSRRGVKEFLDIILGVNMSLGSVQNCLERTSEALAPVDYELNRELSKQPVLNADETGWNDSWLWIFVSSTFIYFRVAASRGSDVLQNVLGDNFNGVLCVDRWGAYSKFHKGKFQFCWAHLKRDIKKLNDIGEKTENQEALDFSNTVNRLRKRIMRYWHKFKDGKIDRETLKSKTASTRSEMKRILKDNLESETGEIGTFSRGLYSRWDGLFTFIFHDDVEPTNNIAEQGIRPAVQWRKVCFGSRSYRGAVMTSRLLTATRTCWLQKRNPLEFLVDCISNHREKGKRLTSLLQDSAA
jgi:transposase